MPEVGQRLFMAPGTVERHVTSIYRKLAVKNRAELVRHLLGDPSQGTDPA